MREIKAGLDDVKSANPNLVEHRGQARLRRLQAGARRRPVPTRTWTKARQDAPTLMRRRATLRIGMPRVLNMYSLAPLFTAYFESLGVPPGTSSSPTTPPRRSTARGRGAARSTRASRARSASRTSHNLLYVHHQKKPLDVHLLPDGRRAADAARRTRRRRARARPSRPRPRRSRRRSRRRATSSRSTGSPTWTASSISRTRSCSSSRCSTASRRCSGLSREENERACVEAWKALRGFDKELRDKRPRDVSTSSSATSASASSCSAGPTTTIPGSTTRS